MLELKRNSSCQNFQQNSCNQLSNTDSRKDQLDLGIEIALIRAICDGV